MKRILLIAICLLGLKICSAQVRTDTVRIPGSGYRTSVDSIKSLVFDGKRIVDIRKATPEELTRIYSRRRIQSMAQDRFFNVYAESYAGMFPRMSLVVRFEANTGAEVYMGKQWSWGTLSKNHILISGTSGIELADGLITPQNASEYRYRIIKNDNTILSDWKIPGDFQKTKDGKFVYASLGGIASQANQFIQVEIYNINNYKDRDALIIDWRPARKLQLGALMSYKSLSWARPMTISLGKDREAAGSRINFLKTDTLSDVKFHLGDSLLRMEFVSHHLPTPYDYQMTLRETISGKTRTSDLGLFNRRFELNKIFWNQPGKYELDFVPVMIKYGGHKRTYLESKKLTYKFTVLPALDPARIFSTRELLLIGLLVTGVFAVVLLAVVSKLRQRNRRRLAKAQQQKDLARTQLQSVRAQLNPHFMFNALSGIQNLMNRNEADTANRYLGKFARITRNVLNNAETITISGERALLEDYLQMEQLRFPFTYELNVGPDLDVMNIEIPSMLLQPFVENCVKHGLKNGTGHISISFRREGSDIVLTVADTGSGYDTAKNYSGFGLQLSGNRVSLLNSIYKETPTLLQVTSSEKGTIVMITLKQWL